MNSTINTSNGIGSINSNITSNNMKINFEEILPILCEQKYNQDKIFGALNQIACNLTLLYSKKDKIERIFTNITIGLSVQSGNIGMKVININFNRENLYKMPTGYDYIIPNCNVELDLTNKILNITGYNNKVLESFQCIKMHETTFYKLDHKNIDLYFETKEKWHGRVCFDIKGKICYKIEKGALGIHKPAIIANSLTYSFTTLKLIE